MPDSIADLVARHDLWTGLGANRAWFVGLVLVLSWGWGLGVVLGYHRVLTHRAAKLNRWLEYFLITFGLPAGTPIQWIGNHRNHHATTDTPADDHSPVQYGFWTAHAGWYLHTRRTLPAVLYTFAGPLRGIFDAFWRPRTNQQYVHLARDVAADPYYAWLSRPGPYALVVLSHVLAPLCTTFVLFGGSMTLVLVGLEVLFYATGDSVNSLCHMIGKRTFVTKDASGDIWWLAPLSFGDSFHNGHHAFPSSVRAGFEPHQWDFAYFWCRVFERLGLARELRLPTPEAIETNRRRPDDQAPPAPSDLEVAA
jgi:stearoyl-CoA desaturase (delta-9 desaturase)